MKKRILWSVGVWLCLLSLARGQNINRIEYYINTDPGVGSGTAVTFTAASTIAQTFTVPLGNLPEGFHWLGVRARDENGRWSNTIPRPFTREEVKTPPALPLLAGIEYFIDDDPGFGLGLPIAVPSGSTATVSFNVPLPTDLPEGFHFLSIRTKDVSNKWSLAVLRPFLKQRVAVSDPAAALVAMEYFIDQDPGYGQGTAVAFAPNQESNNVTFMVPLPNTVPEGYHFLSVRVKDSNNRWSTVVLKNFYKASTTLPPIPNLARLEYFIDRDPGEGAGIAIPFSPGTTAPNVNFNADLTGLTEGTHRLMIRGMDSFGKWGIIGMREITVCTSPIIASLSAPEGGFPLCPSSSYPLGVASGYASYQWNLNGQPISGANTNQYGASLPGLYSVTIGNSGGCTITTNTVKGYSVSPPTMLSTNQTICPGQRAIVAVSGCEGVVTWSNGSTGASIEVNPATTTSYTATCGATGFCTSDPSSPVIITVNPATPALTLTGPGTICPGTAATLTASACNGTVQWSNGSTGTTLTVSPAVTTAYTATCIPTEGCPSPISAAYTVTVTNTTADDMVITTRSQAICPGGSVTLRTTGCTGTVQWSTGATGSTLTVSPTATTLYTATCTQNTCSAPARNSVQITMNVAPAAPIMRSSGESVCSGKAIVLRASQCIGTITWSNGVIGRQQTVRPTETTTYTAFCTVDGCTSPASTPVTINVSDCADPNVNIARVEYFLDSDPGFGNGSPVSFTPGPVVKTSFVVDMGNAADGYHRLTVRARDSQGRWSVITTTPIYKLEAPVSIPLRPIVRAEYFIDQDPGFGLGKHTAFTPATSISAANFTVALTDTLPDGIHVLTVRTQDNSGKWSISVIRQFLKETLIDPTTLQKVEYFVDTDPGFGNGTNLPLPSGNGLTGTPGGVKDGTEPAQATGISEATLTVPVPLAGLSSGTHRLYTRVQNSTGKWGVVGVSTFEICTVPINATLKTMGPTTVCVGNTVKLKVNPGYTYQWYKNGEVISGITDSSYVATTSGIYRVLVSNGTCSTLTSEISVQINPGSIPLVPSVSPVSQTVCSGQSATLTAGGCTGGVITWSNGTSSRQLVINPITTAQYTATCTLNSCISDASLPTTLSISSGPSICESTGSGSWSDTSKWSCGRIPTSCDDVIVRQGHIINLNTEGRAKNLGIQDNGQIVYGVGGMLKMGVQ